MLKPQKYINYEPFIIRTRLFFLSDNIRENVQAGKSLSIGFFILGSGITYPKMESEDNIMRTQTDTS